MTNLYFVISNGHDREDVDRRPSYADVTERLLAEFGDVLGVKLVSDVIMARRTREDGLPELITPDALEHLCRLQLDDLAPA